MNMKWNPIIDGDLSGIPRDEEFLFTIFDERDGETYVTTAWIIEYDGEYDGELEVREASASGLIIHEAENVKAWMEIPEPFKPGRCDICKHWKSWIDNFGDRWSKCELMEIGTFVPLQKCPLKK